MTSYGDGDAEEFEEYIPVAKRRDLQAHALLHHHSTRGGALLAVDAAPPPPPSSASAAESKPSLLVKASQLKNDQPDITPMEQFILQEKEMIDHLSDRKTLMSVRELAKGITYTDPIPTGWKPPLSSGTYWSTATICPLPSRTSGTCVCPSPCSGGSGRRASSSPLPFRIDEHGGGLCLEDGILIDVDCAFFPLLSAYPLWSCL